MSQAGEAGKSVLVRFKRAISKPKVVLFALVVGVALGAWGMWTAMTYNPKDEPVGESPTVVFGRICEQNELITASQGYSYVDKVTDAARLFDWFDIPFTTNSFWYRYVGTLKAGVTLETAEIETQDRSVTITLDQPFISSNDPDMEASGVLEENNNIFHPISIEKVDEFKRECERLSEQEAAKGGLFEEAKENAEKNLRELFYAAFGDAYEVAFVWRDSAEEQ